MDSYSHRMAVEYFKHQVIDSTGMPSDDLPFSELAIVKSLQESRANIIAQTLRSGQAEISEYMVQTLPCVQLREMDRNECPCAPASGCYWLRSVEPLPTPIRTMSVTGIVASQSNPRFEYLKWDRFQYIPTSRVYSMRKGRYYTFRTIQDKTTYLYLYGDRFLEECTISAIWEDPISAAQYPNCGKVDTQALCNPLDVDFYTDAWMRESVINVTIQKMLSTRAAASADILNNDLPNLPSAPQTR